MFMCGEEEDHTLCKSALIKKKGLTQTCIRSANDHKEEIACAPSRHKRAYLRRQFDDWHALCDFRVQSICFGSWIT